MIFSLFDFPIKAARIHIKKSVKLMNVTQCKLQISFSTESNIEYRKTLLQWYSNVEISWFYLANIGQPSMSPSSVCSTVLKMTIFLKMIIFKMVFIYLFIYLFIY